MTNDAKILVVGVGNVLLMDELLDAGTDIFRIMSSDANYGTIIVVDAINRNTTPGTVFCFLVVEDLNVEIDNDSIRCRTRTNRIRRWLEYDYRTKS
jgi:Ni,Fe-hydrogenase maturation factor